MVSASSAAYGGIPNLEVMDAARNYNAFLTDRIFAFAPPAGAILDFGAGIGTFARRLATAGRSVRCVEPDATLRERLKSAGLPAVAAVSELPPDSVDYVYSLNVLEHIENDLEALREIRQRLKPGSRLMLYVPAFPCLYSSMDRMVGHFRRYRRHQLVALVRGAGFEVERARYCDCLGFLAALAFKSLDAGTGRLSERAVVIYDRFIFPLSWLLDHVLGWAIGKNLLLVARRPRA